MEYSQANSDKGERSIAARLTLNRVLINPPSGARDGASGSGVNKHEWAGIIYASPYNFDLTIGEMGRLQEPHYCSRIIIKAKMMPQFVENILAISIIVIQLIPYWISSMRNIP